MNGTRPLYYGSGGGGGYGYGGKKKSRRTFPAKTRKKQNTGQRTGSSVKILRRSATHQSRLKEVESGTREGMFMHRKKKKKTDFEGRAYGGTWGKNKP